MSIPAPTPIPQPPDDPDSLDPLEYVWAEQRIMHRCYDIAWAARDYYAGDEDHRGRFHPFNSLHAGEDLPVLYAAADELGALSETVFHDVPVRGTKIVAYSKLIRQMLVALAPTRALRLVDLTSDGLRRLGLARAELIESDPRGYEDTARWAQALHAHPGAFDGLAWISRQRDTSLAVVLFGDRVSLADLEVPPDHYGVTLALGEGLDRVCEIAARADITITGLADPD